MKSAIIDDVWRYQLTRTWDHGGRHVCWVMLNPSTADADHDDPTIRKCAGFTARWGFDGFIVVNLFAYRATNPREIERLLRAGDQLEAVGLDNITFALRAMECSHRVVVAWGASQFANWSPVYREIMRIDRELFTLGLTKSGAPKHPLYVPYSAELIPFRPLRPREGD